MEELKNSQPLADMNSFGEEEEKHLMEKEMFILARYMYRIGKPITTDDNYEAMENFMKVYNYLPEYLSRTYDDDPEPLELLVKHKLLPAKVLPTKRDTSFLQEDKSLSIRKVESEEEAFKYFQKFKFLPKIASLKKDGLNLKAEVKNEVLKLVMTRGRTGLAKDVTDALLKYIPTSGLKDRHVLRMEVMVEPSYLEELRNKYGTEQVEYSTPKSAALALIGSYQNYSEEDFRHLKVYVHSVTNLAGTLSECYDRLTDSGLLVPAYKRLEPHPENFEEFKVWLHDLMDEMYEKVGDSCTDGLVIDLDDLYMDTTVTGQYDERNIALKFRNWKSPLTEATVASIVMEQRGFACCCKVTLVPTRAYDGTKATVLNTYNPSFLFGMSIEIGDTILFERKGGSMNLLVHGEKRTIQNEAN